MDIHGISNFIGTNKVGEAKSAESIQQKKKEKEQSGEVKPKFDKVEISAEGRAAMEGKKAIKQDEVGVQYNARGQVTDKKEEDINDAMAAFFGS